MPTQCFMVESVMEAFDENGEQRVGAMMWRNHERYEEWDLDPRPMPHLGIMTPAGLICLDCPETEPPHAYWSRSGEPPLVTVTPSLNVNHEAWHGWITNGVLTP